MLTGKRTERRHLLRDAREQAAALAKANPKGWAEKARHERALHQLLHRTAVLRSEGRNEDRAAAWGLHADIVQQWHQTWGRLTEPLADAEAALKSGDTSGLGTILDFLEADPYFDQSGYFKERLIPLVLRCAFLTPATTARLRQAVLNRVQGYWGREFPFYKRLAKAVDSPELRRALQEVLDNPDLEVQARARSILRHLNGEPMPSRFRA